MTTIPPGAADAVTPNHFITKEVFCGLLEEVYERLVLAESRLDDSERLRDGLDRKVERLRIELDALKAAS